jgi:hypothetical protein
MILKADQVSGRLRATSFLYHAVLNGKPSKVVKPHRVFVTRFKNGTSDEFVAPAVIDASTKLLPILVVCAKVHKCRDFIVL